MKKLKKKNLFLIISLIVVSVFSLSTIKTVKAYDSIDSTKATEWTVNDETIKNNYGLYYSNMHGIGVTKGGMGSEKTVNYFRMKTDGENSKLVTWLVQKENYLFSNTKLTDLAKDYEKNHPGWIVVAGINADQWYYHTTLNDQKGGYFYFENQTYYPFAMDGQNLFTINPNGGTGNGVAFTNDSSNPIIEINGGTCPIMLQIYDENDQMIAQYEVAGYNKTASQNEVTVWSGYINPSIDKSQEKRFINREVSSNSDLYIVEKAELAYMNNARDYASVNDGNYNAVDSFYGRGKISTTAKSATLTEGQFAIETTNPEVIAKLSVGVKVIVEQQFAEASANEVESVTGYHTIQVKDGVQQNTESSYNTASKPRSVFGINKDGSYFLLTTRDTKRNTTGGTFHTETNAILNYYDAYTAYQDDGGGSVTAIYRNDMGEFDLVSDSVDSAQAGTQRSILSGLFFVIRDPGLKTNSSKTTTTSITLQKNNFGKTIEDVKVKIADKTYDFTGDELVINDLEENHEYEMTVTYSYQGKTYTTMSYAKTKEYTPKFNFTPKTYGFIIERVQTDDVLRLKSVNFEIDGKSYQMGDVDTFEISGLQKGTKYSVNYTYEIENINTKETFTKKGEEIDVETLSYSEPEIIEFKENRRTSDYIRVEYEYTDKDKLINRAYILVNEEKHILTNELGSLKIDNLDLENGNYKIVLVLEYTVNGRIVTKESEPIIIGNAEHEHVWQDATCESPKKCKICGETEGEALGHNFENGVCTRCGETDPNYQAPKKGCNGCKKNQIMLMISLITIFTSLGLIVRKKH